MAGLRFCDGMVKDLPPDRLAYLRSASLRRESPTPTKPRPNSASVGGSGTLEVVATRAQCAASKHALIPLARIWGHRSEEFCKPRGISPPEVRGAINASHGLSQLAGRSRENDT
jgi:hypothetical protein